MHRNFLFDLDQTLLDFHASEYMALEIVLKENNLSFSDEIYSAFKEYNKSLWLELEKGMITRNELFAKRFDYVIKKSGGDPALFDLLKINDDFIRTMSQNGVLMDGALSFVRKVKIEIPDASIYIASNGATINAKGRLASTGLDKYIDGLFISEDMGVAKPAAEFFDIILDKVGEDKDSFIMIGDSLTSDMLGAKKASLTSVWFMPTGDVEEAIKEYDIDYCADSFDELFEILNDNELLFYDEYENFYKMTGKSKAFEKFCREAFGQDFSQDGFSDINQINRILKYIPKGEDVHILDVGCGNGKMLGYLQDKTGAYIHGFDYSESAIDTAKKLFQTKADFKQGKIGETDYPAEQFDLVVSMDSMYFAPDMEKFVLQIMRWLKKDGVLFVGYQEGDVMPKTDNEKTTVLARALDNCGIQYEVEDITSETYELLKKKRDAALLYQKDFEKEGNKDWLDLLLLQTDCVTEGYDSFAQKMARYIYVVRKNELGRRG